MRCEEADRLLESIAGGDKPASDELAHHLDTCARCTAAAALVRKVDHLLAERPVVAVPSGFARTVVERLRADRWRAERNLDLGFNLAIAAGLILVVAGVWLLLNASGLTAVAQDVATIFADGMSALVTRVAIGLPTYSAAAGLVMTALGVWWWAERGFSVH